MASWNRDFLDLLTALNDADAKYLLLGGHAVGLYAVPRATKDFDLWVEAAPENARKVVAALKEFGAPLGSVSALDFSSPGNGFRMGTPPFRIEILTQVSGLEFGGAWTRRKKELLDGVACHVIAIEDLVANKKAAGRPQDLADVAALEQAQKKSEGG
jgi:hypothetical protein